MKFNLNSYYNIDILDIETIKTFQRSNGLCPDGTIGVKSIKIIEAIIEFEIKVAIRNGKIDMLLKL